jgi:hypothetical protein
MNTMTRRRRTTNFLWATLTAGALSLSQISPAAAEEYVNVLQYEISLSAERPVSNFYLSWQPRIGADFERPQMGIGLTHNLGIQAQSRVPLYSSDPYKKTLFNLIPLAMNVDESKKTSGQAGDSSMTFGVVVLGVTMIGATVYAISQSAKEGTLAEDFVFAAATGG